MNIKKSSWHYKLTDKVIYNGFLGVKIKYNDISLCPYFWAVVISVLMAGLILPFGAVMVAVFATIPFWWLFTDTPWQIAVLVGTIDIIGLLCFWATYRKTLYGYVFAPTKWVDTKIKKSDSLLYQRIKAAHAKVCPILKATVE